MTVHLERAVKALKSNLLALCAVVEERCREAFQAVEKEDSDLAKKVLDGDITINQKEVEIEDECLKILALYQPVAMDLRFLVVVLKINNDLERIGDLAANMASRAIALSRVSGDKTPPFDLTDMSEKVFVMLNDSLDALMQMDAEKAKDVCQADKDIDDIYREVYYKIEALIQEDPAKARVLLNYLSITRIFERIADLATNIAEDVVYLIEGKIIRHWEDDHNQLFAKE